MDANVWIIKMSNFIEFDIILGVGGKVREVGEKFVGEWIITYHLIAFVIYKWICITFPTIWIQFD